MPESRCEKTPDGRHRWLQLPVGRVCQACFVVDPPDDDRLVETPSERNEPPGQDGPPRA